MIFPRDKKSGPADRAAGARVPSEQADDAGAKASEAVPAQAEPVRDGKFKERAGPEEAAKLRYDRKRRELVEKMDELKKGGLGDVHPAVRSVADALEKLEAEQGGR